MKKLFCLLFVFAFAKAYSQQDSLQFTATEIVNKSIAYHDPDGNWGTFDAEFTVMMRMPDRPDRLSDISIDLYNEMFSLQSRVDSASTDYTVKKDSVNIVKVNTNNDLVGPEDKQRALMMRDYYTYLYGLPMKLKDEGTIINDEVEKVWFWNINAYKVKVTYDEDVGNDVWYFYFDPETFALKAYQFFKTDDDGELLPESGEYILLSKPKMIDGINIPGHRMWFYNKDTSFLALDRIVD
jgi:catechol 2,3-dioxygenase-like lactoylglutathione lyase family enzyme